MSRLSLACRAWSRVLADLLAIALLGTLELGVYLAEERGVVAERRGFYCDDTSIRLPFRHSTVPGWALALCSVAVPFFAILIGNCLEHYVTKYKCSKSSFKPLGSEAAPKACLKIPAWLARMGYHMRWYYIGLLITVIITDTSKIVIGRLRPNFIDVCKPDFSRINCTDVFGNPVYVTDYVCTGDQRLIPDTRYSWPSGHSSISAYTFVFVCFYIAGVRIFYNRSALKMMLILFSFLLTLLCALSRITDHKHHPTDVLTGLILGATVAAIVAYYNLYFFSHFNHQKADTSGCRRTETTAVCQSVREIQPDSGEYNTISSPEHKV